MISTNYKLRIEKCKLIFVVAWVLVLARGTAVAVPFTFDDIEFWVGSGVNQAAVVIDWVEESTDPPALVWGFRWDGTAKGRDMLLAVVSADDQLFAKLGMTLGEIDKLYGVGYDANNSGEFAIEDGTEFDTDGIAIGSAPTIGTTPSDPGDYYVEGWEFDFWHYGVGIGNPFNGGHWLSSPVGMEDRTLANGVWDSWTFEGTAEPPFNAFAENPIAAAFSYPPGDFNRDTLVDTADYELWKSKFGSISDPAVDANGNGIVDAADFTIWRDNISDSRAGSSAGIGRGVPEPASWMLLLACFLFNFTVIRQRKE